MASIISQIVVSAAHLIQDRSVDFLFTNPKEDAQLKGKQPLQDIPPVPATIPDSFARWWKGEVDEGGAFAERLLLKHFDLVSHDDQVSDTIGANGKVKASLGPVVFRGENGHENYAIQTFVCPPLGSSSSVAADDGEEPVDIVLAHGFGAGLGFFYPTLRDLSDRLNTLSPKSKRRPRIIAFDWRGMGRSSRPRFPSSFPSTLASDTTPGASRQDRSLQAEDFFVQSLESLRTRLGVRNMVLVGHSLGGYLSITYSIKHPQSVRKLILLSPAGMCPNPGKMVVEKGENGTDSDRIEKEHQTSFEPLVADSEPLKVTETAAEDILKSSPESDVQPNMTPTSKLHAQDGLLYQFLCHLWQYNITPLTIARHSAFFGPWMVAQYVGTRFEMLPREDVEALQEYSYALMKSPASGELLLDSLLEPGAYPQYAPLPRLHSSPSPALASMPISVMYGSADWMTRISEQDLLLPKGRRTADEVEQMKRDRKVKVVEVKGAAHNLCLDGDDPALFNNMLWEEMAGCL